jgi:hypothetical protein
MASLINPSNIDVTYPIAGQDNDTQGFRTNYQNIKNNFIVAAGEITAIQSNVATLQSQTYANTNVANYLPIYTGNLSAQHITLSSAIQFANLTTAQINSIFPTTTGMTVYNYNTGNIQVYNGTKWANITLS